MWWSRRVKLGMACATTFFFHGLPSHYQKTNLILSEYAFSIPWLQPTLAWTTPPWPVLPWPGPSSKRTEHQCAAYCLTAEPSKFSYSAGQTYHYGFRSTVRTDLRGASDETSSLEVTARAEIVANSACDLTLQVSDEHWWLSGCSCFPDHAALGGDLD